MSMRRDEALPFGEVLKVRANSSKRLRFDPKILSGPLLYKIWSKSNVHPHLALRNYIFFQEAVVEGMGGRSKGLPAMRFRASKIVCNKLK